MIFWSLNEQLSSNSYNSLNFHPKRMNLVFEDAECVSLSECLKTNFVRMTIIFKIKSSYWVNIKSYFYNFIFLNFCQLQTLISLAIVECSTWHLVLKRSVLSSLSTWLKISKIIGSPLGTISCNMTHITKKRVREL